MRGDETGGIITDWLLQVVIFLAIVGLVGFEAITIAVTSVNLQDDAQDVARTAARTYKSARRLPPAREAAEELAEQREVTLVDVTEEDGVVTVTIIKQADTLVVHNIGLFDDLVEADAEASARWR